MEIILQKEVDRIAKLKQYKEDYGIKLKVSILLEDTSSKHIESHKILLTAMSGDVNRSRVIFPKNSVHDYIPLAEEIRFLVNSLL